jgi:hypothetical protein
MSSAVPDRRSWVTCTHRRPHWPYRLSAVPAGFPRTQKAECRGSAIREHQRQRRVCKGLRPYDGVRDLHPYCRIQRSTLPRGNNNAFIYYTFRYSKLHLVLLTSVDVVALHDRRKHAPRLRRRRVRGLDAARSLACRWESGVSSRARRPSWAISNRSAECGCISCIAGTSGVERVDGRAHFVRLDGRRNVADEGAVLDAVTAKALHPQAAASAAFPGNTFVEA